MLQEIEPRDRTDFTLVTDENVVGFEEEKKNQSQNPLGQIEEEQVVEITEVNESNNNSPINVDEPEEQP